jgi:hypothetical protein
MRYCRVPQGGFLWKRRGSATLSGDTNCGVWLGLALCNYADTIWSARGLSSRWNPEVAQSAEVTLCAQTVRSGVWTETYDRNGCSRDARLIKSSFPVDRQSAPMGDWAMEPEPPIPECSE